MNRRQFVLGAAALAAARSQDVNQSYAAEMPDMLVTYFSRRLNAEARRWDAERTHIRTPQQIRDRNQFVRDKIREMAGPFPERTPLAARTTHTLDRPDYRIENVMFQSRPDFWVTGNLYVPARTAGPFPAVVMQRGHFDPMRMAPDYRQVHHDLVRSGFVVLSFDPIGQGERRQHLASGTEEFDELLSPTLEHCALGGLLSLVGESLAGYFLWDGMRAIDYLMERPEVNPAKVACADYTDTGWSALFLAALDPRIQCAAIHARGTARRWPLNPDTWNQIDDPEQYLYPAANHGVDLLDTLVAVAPRPLLVLVEDASGDFDSSTNFLRTRYTQMGNAEKFAVEAAKPGQEWPRMLRLETVRWFRRWLRGDLRPIKENDVVPEPFSALYATFNGSLREAGMGEPIYADLRKRAANLPPASSATLLATEIRDALSLGPATAALNPREWPPEQSPGYRFGRVEFLSEPGIYIPGGLYRPDHPNGKVVVYTSADVTTFVPEVDAELASTAKSDADQEEETPHHLAQVLAWQGYTVLVIDVRGLGETAPKSVRRALRGPYEHLRNTDVALATLAWSLGESLFALRVRDVLRAAEYASQFGSVRLAGSGMGALWALFAAAVEPRIAGAAIQGGLLSYRMLIEHSRYMQAASQFLPGVLQHFDLPQVAGAVAPRPLIILAPTDHMKHPVAPQAAEPLCNATRDAYQRAGVPNRFQLEFQQGLAECIAKLG